MMYRSHQQCDCYTAKDRIPMSTKNYNAIRHAIAFICLVVIQSIFGCIIPLILTAGFFVEEAKIYTPIYNTINWFAIAIWPYTQALNTFALMHVGYIINAIGIIGVIHLIRRIAIISAQRQSHTNNVHN